ncbi:hypothetical protein J3R82DRAFT_8088 [Butyriboletus roseoflavus]|nr:hypothetical protein J3R82DRAFT_8088 [Butyriboletus roseoflavus]
MAQKLHPQAQRLRAIIVTAPIIGATACAFATTWSTTASRVSNGTCDRRLVRTACARKAAKDSTSAT